MKIRHLVTGAGGFIGKHLAEYIKKNHPGSETVALGRKDCDLSDAAASMKFFQNAGSFDYVFHCADVSGNARWAAAHSAEQFFANAKISLNVLEAVSKHQPKARLIGLSSLWAYPAATELAKEESYWDGPLHRPTQHYGLNKKFFGVGLEACKNQLQTKGTMLVLGSVYGPGDHSDHVIPSLIQKMKDNPREIEVWGDGSQVRDFIYVEDQVQAIYLHKDFDGELLNISGGKSHSIRQVTEALAKLMDYKGKIVFKAGGAASRDEKRMDMTLANKLTGWPTQYKLRSLDDGLRLTLQGNS